MAAWAATAIRQSEPESSLIWACERRCMPVIASPELAEMVEVFPREQWRRRRWAPGTWMQQVRKYLSLRRYRFDLGIDMQGHTKTALCLRLSGAKRRVGARATDVFARSLNRVVFDWDETKNEVSEYLEFVRSLGYTASPKLPLMPNVQCKDLEDRVVTIQTGAGAADKLYPAENWNDVARQLQQRGCRVVALGAHGDPELDTEWAEDQVGHCSLSNSMQWIRSSAVHLSGDTGTAHIAAAYGVPTVTVFGPTPSERFRPYGDFATVLSAGFRTNKVSPEMIVEAATVAMEARGKTVLR